MTARTDRKIALIAGTILAAAFTLCAATSVASWTIGSVEHTSHKVYPGPVSALTIEARSGDITLVPSDTDEVVVDSRASGTLHTPKLHVEPDGGRLVIAGGCPEITFGNCETEIVVRVPAGTAVTVDAASGDLFANGLSGDLQLRTASGDVDASDLAGNVTLESSSGDINGAALRSARVQANTASGDVNLQLARVPEAVGAETASGDVNISVPPSGDLYRVDAETDSGDVNDDGVAKSDESERVLRARTNSGDITIDYR